jgi:predicted phage replisome organizer
MGMADVKWIKIVTDIFDDEKIKFIETLPNGDEIIVIWFKLLCLAGKSNSSGFLMFTNKLAYTEEMLASIFKRDIKVIQFAIATFVNLEMLEVVEDRLYISNWGKHQSLDKLEAKKAYDREYQRKRREEKKLALENRTTIERALNDSRSIDIDIDKERDRDKDNNKEIEAAPDKKPVRHKYGMYNNVLLTDEDMGKLQSEFPGDWQQRIERLSEYMASTGKSYKNHLATIRNWARKDKPQQQRMKNDRPPTQHKEAAPPSKAEQDEFMRMMEERARKRKEMGIT